MDAAVEAQLDRAKCIVSELRANGHDEITVLDLLDVLACAGLMLVPIETAGSNVPSEAYMSLLTS